MRTEAHQHQIGNYRLLEPLAQGGMGVIWLAHHRMLNRDAAIKVIRRDVLANHGAEAAALERRFEREARALSGLKSSHTVDIHDFGITDDNTVYYAMELLDGLGLDALVRQYGHLPPARVVHILRQACDSLAEAHRSALIHRDIKPANIMVCRYGLKRDFVKVLDFGLVKDLQPDDDQTATKAGAVTGTPTYMSPEALSAPSAVDARSDIYALGAVGYFLLTGEHVFTGSTVFEVGAAHLHDTPQPPSERLGSSLPPALEGLILRCLAKEPEQRPQTVEALDQELGECPLDDAWSEEDATEWWQTHTPTTRVSALDSSPLVSMPAPSRQHQGRTKWVALALGALTLLALGAGAWAWRDPSVPPRPASIAATETKIESIAVLPLTNQGPAEHDDIVNGLHDALIAELGRVEALSVISQTSVERYRNSKLTTSEIAQELEVDAILEGSVLWTGNGMVRITVKLLGVAPERQLWTEVFEGETRDILHVQKRLVSAVAEKTRVTITPKEQARLAKNRPVNPVSYTSHLRGRHLCNSFVLEQQRRGVELYKQAIQNDPSYAPAHAGLAQCHANMGFLAVQPPEEWFPLAEAAVLKALELDDALGEAHGSLAYITFLHKWDAVTARRHFDRARELEPNSVGILLSQARFFTMLGEHDSARAAYDRAVELDPLSPTTAVWRAWGVGYMTRHYDESLVELQRILGLDPNYTYAHLWIAVNYTMQQRFAEAVAKAEDVERLAPNPTDQNLLAVLGWIYGRAGRSDGVRRMLRGFKSLTEQGRWVDPYYLGVLHMGSNDNDETFRWMRQAFERRSCTLVLLFHQPMADTIRSDPRWKQLMSDVGID